MTTMGALGAALVVAGGALAVRSAMLLGGRGRPRRGPRPAFVVAGPYLRLRNPLVAGLLVATAGVALAGRSPGLAVVTLIAAAASHVWVVYVEEPRLTARFGAAYEAYLRRVPRWLPRSTSPGEPAG
jgi:protein-S-isoprenylcysteine O-methyltransferase Ste14